MDVPVHFSLKFTTNYPSEAPQVRLFSPVPHPNVTKDSVRDPVFGQLYKLAVWDCVPQQNSWSSAYTVQSILIQLQAFLMEEDMLYATSQVIKSSLASFSFDSSSVQYCLVFLCKEKVLRL